MINIENEIVRLFEILKNDDAILMHNLTEKHKLNINIMSISERSFGIEIYSPYITHPFIDLYFEIENNKFQYSLHFYTESKRYFPEIECKFRIKYENMPMVEKNHDQIIAKFDNSDSLILFLRECLI